MSERRAEYKQRLAREMRAEMRAWRVAAVVVAILVITGVVI